MLITDQVATAPCTDCLQEYSGLLRKSLVTDITHFAAATGLLRNLERLLAGEGHFFLTSRISNDRFVGDRYLSALYRMREFVPPRTGSELRSILNEALQREFTYTEKGNMAFVSA
jgi:hypothetical protein